MYLCVKERGGREKGEKKMHLYIDVQMCTSVYVRAH